MDDLLGTEVGNYRLIRVLGEGGMGRVYVGEQAAIASRVAIKVLTTQDPELVGRFFAEARAVNVIKHPGLVKVQALAYLPDGRPYIIMELVEGETLRTLVERDSPLPVGGVLDAMKQLLGALAAAHAHGVVHRDLKPDNVMLTPDGTVKVLDFGIAKLSPTLSGGITPRTRTGSQIGTPAYMAPEQIRGVGVDARTDIYTAGVVMFEALTGRLPFEARTEFELMRGHLEVTPPRVSSLRGGLPPALDAIVEQTLAKRPEERFQSASALMGALASVQVPAERLVAQPAISMKLQQAAIASTNDAHHVTRDASRATVDERPRLTPDVTRPASPRPRVAGTPDRLASQHVPDALHRVTVERPRPSDRAIAGAPVAAGERGANRRWLVVPAVVVVGGAIVAAFVLGRRGAPTEAPRGGTGGSAVVTMGLPSSRAFDVPGMVPPSSDGAPGGAFSIQRGRDDVRGSIVGTIDPAVFDPVASIPRAKELAQQLMPGVVFVELLLGDVDKSGQIHFSDGGYASYHFAIPNVKDDSQTNCAVTVVASRAGWSGLTGRAFCANDGELVLRCKLDQIWTRGLDRGGSGDITADIRVKQHTWWFLQRRNHNTAIELPDDCKAPATKPSVRTTPAMVLPDNSDPNAKVKLKPFDVDAKHFDLVAYIPKARAFARELVPGVDLHLLTLQNVNEEGLIDVDTDRRNPSSLIFATTSGECWTVAVLFINGQIMAAARRGTGCDAIAIVRAPRCTVAELFRRYPGPHAGFVTYSSYGWGIDTKTVGDDCN